MYCVLLLIIIFNCQLILYIYFFICIFMYPLNVILYMSYQKKSYNIFFILKKYILYILITYKHMVTCIMN